MSDVRLDPQQVPVRAELLLAAELGEDAPGQSTPGWSPTITTTASRQFASRSARC